MSAHEDVIWHELECGSYSADLPLWRELAATSPGPILDVGAGTGRVCIDLAQAGHSVTAIDLDLRLLEALRARAAGLSVKAICADARSFELTQKDFGLCVVAMQTIQLLGGPAARMQALARIRAHLRSGGVAACAILTAVEPFDCSIGDSGPAPETVWADGNVYVSRPTRVALEAASVVIERQREVLASHKNALAAGIASGRSGPGRRSTRDVVALRQITVEELEGEAQSAGLAPAGVRYVSATEDHAGSTVVMLRA